MFRNPLVDALVVLIVVLLIFGPKRLPLLGRSLGQGMREFKDSITGHSEEAAEEGERPALSQPPAPPPAPVADQGSAEVGSSERRV